MATDPLRDAFGCESPDTATSDGNSSVQVHLDSCSNRGRSTSSRSRSPSLRPSPSRAREPSLARQATANSLSSFLSSQGSSHQPQNDRPPVEDLLRDLIAITEPSSSSNVTTAGLHSLKRPREVEVADEPLPKRDKLSEELDRMHGLPQLVASIPASSGPSATSTFRTPAQPITTSGTSDLGDPIRTISERGRLPIRAARRRPPPLSNGAATPDGCPSEVNEPASPSDDEGDGAHNMEWTC